MDRIVSRIDQIEERIKEIQSFGSLKKSQKTTPPKVEAPKETFSEILQEVMQSKNVSDTVLNNDADGSMDILKDLANVGNIKNNLLENKVDSLISAYNQTGKMPTAQPKPINPPEFITNNPGTWDNIIAQAATQYSIDERLIHAVIQTESAYNPNAVSRVGAEGLMQLMPYTAKDLDVTDSFDPTQNILGGTKYLRQMLDRYKGDLIKSLAAYNAGPEAVDKANGIPNYKETREYVPKVLNYYYNMNQ